MGEKMSGSNSAVVESFYDDDSNTFSYVVVDRKTQSCAVIDSVLDFDYASGSIGYESADEIIEFICQRGLHVEYLIETHVHADHLSAAPYLQQKIGGKIAISKHIVSVQEEFGKVFNEGTEFERDGSQFDLLLEDNHQYTIGNLKGIALHTPGHTPACMTHVIDGMAFVGDTLFMPDGGTARADFPGGDARVLYRSIQRILNLPSETKLYMCHDYRPNGRELSNLTSVAEQRECNIHVRAGVTEDEFVAIRESRDATLPMPKLILPSLQVNMRAGHFPPADANDTVYLKVPLKGVLGDSRVKAEKSF